MFKSKRAYLIGFFVVLVTLIAGADGDCSFGESSDCLFFCS